MKKITIRDVAKHANVSVATVSRVLNKTDYPISKKNRVAVVKAIKELHYVPNKSAQNLKYNKSQLIGLIVRDIADPYFAEIAKGVTETAVKYGYLALVCNSKRNIEYELAYHDTLRQHNVAGIIIAGAGYLDYSVQEEMKKRIELSMSLGISSIALAPQGFEIPNIGVDNNRIGRKIGQYLIVKKHRKIAFVGGDSKIIVNQQRMNGFLEVMKENHIVIHENNIVQDEFTWEGGYRSAKKLLERSRDITAICCANDNIAIGVIRYIEEIGLKVPKDISIIGVGDIILADYTSPKLTTAKIPFYEMGQKCVELICNKADVEELDIKFNVQIIERDSVAECKLLHEERRL